MRSLLLLLLAAGSAPAVPAADLASEIEAIRREGCGRQSGMEVRLQRADALDRAARSLADGASLETALARAGFRAVQAGTLEVTGNSRESMLRTLAQRGCGDILNPAYTAFGSFARGTAAWIVLAEPFVPPTARDAGAIRREILSLVNDARSRSRRCGWKREAAAGPLTASESLDQAALAHARDLARRGVLSHTGADGSGVGERVTRAGYAWSVVGENIAAGQPTAARVVAEWLRSPEHCRNIMDPGFAEMGVAFVTKQDSPAAIYWAQVFATPRP